MQISALIAIQVGRESEYHLLLYYLALIEVFCVFFFFAEETDIYQKAGYLYGNWGAVLEYLNLSPLAFKCYVYEKLVFTMDK